MSDTEELTDLLDDASAGTPDHPELAKAPVTLRHAVAVYDYMEKRAQGQYEDFPLWEGSTTSIFSEASIPINRYSHIMRTLQKMDCLRQLRRGGGTTPSAWMLIKPPTAAAYKATATEGYVKKKADTNRALSELHTRVTQLEARLTRAGI